VSTNLDLVRSIYADWERGDFSRADWADADIEFVIVGGPDPGEWTGLTSMASAWRDVLSAAERYRMRVDGCQEIDAQRVLLLTRRSGRGSEAGWTLVSGWIEPRPSFTSVTAR
jgi:hypothetical protein